MKKSYIAITLIALFFVGASFQSVAQVVVKVRPVRTNVVVVKPARTNHIWVKGHWKWKKSIHAYVWVGGHYVKKRRGYFYTQGYWVTARHRGSKWVPGHWRRA